MERQKRKARKWPIPRTSPSGTCTRCTPASTCYSSWVLGQLLTPSTSAISCAGPKTNLFSTTIHGSRGPCRCLSTSSWRARQCAGGRARRRPLGPWSLPGQPGPASCHPLQSMELDHQIKAHSASIYTAFVPKPRSLSPSNSLSAIILSISKTTHNNPCFTSSHGAIEL
ncbi:hypothetical protein BC830DRAFT_1119389 [Chytriomyces sp. MP71]|nr:hypothetical protein BC830DRAFT_1119389 [Chytriomyces sp. MP71]